MSFIRRRWLVTLLFLAAVVTPCATSWGAGPRWVTGPPWFYHVGYPVAWYTDSPQYFTDPGDLSQYVSHAQADALVAAAAGVWTIPTSRLVLGQGGLLNEHVSSANVAMGANGPVFPADVQLSNWPNKQIAVIYDTDGSVTDLLLGAGASDPLNCLHAGVTESVDGLPQGTQAITHALLILNGRCTGAAPEKQTQLQYQLMRAFGRVLGLSWSQTNDNVFTGTPLGTYNQALNWPIMHPIDIVCGPYTYLCLPNPFTLRADDIAALDTVYTIAQGHAPPGKQDTLGEANLVEGQVVFPNGQGMQGVNVTVQRDQAFYDPPEAWQTVSGVSGYMYRRQGVTPTRATDNSAAGSFGVLDPAREGYYVLSRVPIPDGQAWQNLVVSTEPINPLYIGPYAVGPYTGNQVAESGGTTSQKIWVLANYSDTEVDFGPAGATPTCTAVGDGAETAPLPVAITGSWSGSLCGYGHAAWASFAVKANRSFTVEVTAQDEQGHATTGKVLPTMGLWNAVDATGTLPTVAKAATALNALTVGLTNLTVASATQDRTLRMSIADQRGDGRPDFAYTARVLYADAISPAVVGAAGATVTITGMGFRVGNLVLVNGGQATVTSVTPNAIVARVPSSFGVGAYTGFFADVTVKDPASGGTSVMSSALYYQPGSNTLQLISAPRGTATLNVAATTDFAVKLVAPDGVSAVAGRPVTFSTTGGGVVWGACATATCTATTNAQGIAQTTVMPTVAGAVSVTATTSTDAVTASFNAAAATLTEVSAPTGPVTVGTTAATAFAVRVLAADGVTPMAGVPVQFAVVSGGAIFGACGAATCTLRSDANGLASTTATPTAVGNVGLSAFVTGATPVTAAFAGVNERLRLVSAPAGTQTVGVQAAVSFAVKVLRGDGVTPVANETVVFAGTGGVVRLGACAAATCTLVTDTNGLAQTTVTPMAAGPTTVTATGTSGAVSAAFLAAQPTMQLVSAPSGTVTTGTAWVFAIKILAGDGVSPVSGVAVGISAAGAAVRFGACVTAPCSLVTDGNGVASTSVTPTSSGAITLSAAGSAGVVTAMFTAEPETIRLVSAPSGMITLGQVAGTTVSVEVLAGDGLSPVAGETVSLAGSAGVSLGACGGSASCSVATNASGVVSTTVLATVAGTVAVTATASAGSVSVALTAAARTLVPVRTTEYVAAGATVNWTPVVTLTDTTGSTAGVIVSWTGSTGLVFGTGNSAVGAQGWASESVEVGPMAAWTGTSGMACAWAGTVCASISAVGVGPGQLQVAAVSGAVQAVGAGDVLGPVVLEVTDGAGHGVAGALVSVYQTVSAWQGECPATGRCPTAAVYSSGATTAVSDVDGFVTVLPAQMAGNPEVTQIAAVVGTTGFVTVNVRKHP